MSQSNAPVGTVHGVLYATENQAAKVLLCPVSEKQLKTLEKFGINPDEIDNAGKAAKILDRLDKRRSEGLTTPKQIRFLEGRGFQHVGTWSFEHAKKLIDRIAAGGWRIPAGIDPRIYKPE